MIDGRMLPVVESVLVNMNSWMPKASPVFGFVHHASIWSCLLQMSAIVLNLNLIMLGTQVLHNLHCLTQLVLETVWVGRVFRDRRGHLLVCHLNVRSVLPKSDELHLLLERQDGVVLGLSETWLDESVMDSEVEIPGFKHFRRGRKRRGGGVMVYVPEQFKVVRRKELEDDAVEALWIEIRTVNMVF